MNDLVIFFLGSLAGGTGVTIFAAVMFKRKVGKHARGLYIDGFNDVHEAGKKGRGNPWL